MACFRPWFLLWPPSPKQRFTLLTGPKVHRTLKLLDALVGHEWLMPLSDMLSEEDRMVLIGYLAADGAFEAFPKFKGTPDGLMAKCAGRSLIKISDARGARAAIYHRPVPGAGLPPAACGCGPYGDLDPRAFLAKVGEHLHRHRTARQVH